MKLAYDPIMGVKVIVDVADIVDGEYVEEEDGEEESVQQDDWAGL